MILVGICSVVALNKMKDTNVGPLENWLKINGSVRKVVLKPKKERNLIALMEKYKKNGSHAGFKPVTDRINPSKNIKSHEVERRYISWFLCIWMCINMKIQLFLVSSNVWIYRSCEIITWAFVQNVVEYEQPIAVKNFVGLSNIH